MQYPLPCKHTWAHGNTECLLQCLLTYLPFLGTSCWAAVFTLFCEWAAPLWDIRFITVASYVMLNCSHHPVSLHSNNTIQHTFPKRHRTTLVEVFVCFLIFDAVSRMRAVCMDWILRKGQTKPITTALWDEDRSWEGQLPGEVAKTCWEGRQSQERAGKGKNKRLPLALRSFISN